MMKTTSLICAATLGIAILQGCQTGTSEPLHGYAVNNPAQEMDSIRVIDRSLMRQNRNLFGNLNTRSKIVIEKEGVRAGDTGLPQVWIVVRNLTDHSLALEGRTTWFDGDEIPLASSAGWQRFFVPPHSTETFRDSAIYTDAIYYQVDLREGR